MVDTVGGKAANLGELIGAGFAVPDGFVVTTEAYRAVAGPVDELIGRWDGPELAARARAVVLATQVPAGVAAAVRDGYLGSARTGCRRRSLATAEDLPFASFAGQQDTHLHVAGVDRRRCGPAVPASLWTDRAVATAPRPAHHGQVRLARWCSGWWTRSRAGVLLPPTRYRPAAAGGDRRQPRPGEAVVSGVNPTGSPSTPRPSHLARRLGDKRRGAFWPVVARTRWPCPTGRAFRACSTSRSPRWPRSASGSRRTSACHRTSSGRSTPRARWLTQARPITTLYPLPADAPTDDDSCGSTNVNVAQGMYRPFTPMGLAAFRLIGAGVAELAGRPVTDRRAGPPVLKQAGGRLFVDLTSAVRSTLGRQIVPRIFDVMEARSAVMVRLLFDEPRLSVVYGPGPAQRAIARIAVRCRIPRILLRALLSPGFVRRHLAALRAGLTAGLDLPADPTPADHLRVAERILTERMPALHRRSSRYSAALGSFVLTGKLQPDDPALRRRCLVHAAQRHHRDGSTAVELCAIRHDPAAAAELTGTGAGHPRRPLPRRHAGRRHATRVDRVSRRVRHAGGGGDRPRHAALGRGPHPHPRRAGQLPAAVRPAADPDTQRSPAERRSRGGDRPARHAGPRRGRIRAALVRFGLRRARQLIGYRESRKFLLVTALTGPGSTSARWVEHHRQRCVEHRGRGVLPRFAEASGPSPAPVRICVRSSRPDATTTSGSGADGCCPRILLSDGTEPTPPARELPDGALAGTPASVAP
jgi:pyruvate,water dikinase